MFWNENLSGGGGWPPECDSGKYYSDGHKFSDESRHSFTLYNGNDVEIEIIIGEISADLAECLGSDEFAEFWAKYRERKGIAQ